MKIIIDCNLRYNLDDIIEILKLFQNYKIMSKSEHAYLDYIVKRWKIIKFYL